MKKLLYIASICIASLFSACDDYLTVESPDQLTSSSFWRNQSDAEGRTCRRILPTLPDDLFG